MIKHVLMFVSGLQESVLVDFISQSKVKILLKYSQKYVFLGKKKWPLFMTYCEFK